MAVSQISTKTAQYLYTFKVHQISLRTENQHLYGDGGYKNSAQNSSKHAFSGEKFFFLETSPGGIGTPLPTPEHLPLVPPSPSLLDRPSVPPEFQSDLYATASSCGLTARRGIMSGLFHPSFHTFKSVLIISRVAASVSRVKRLLTWGRAPRPSCLLRGGLDLLHPADRYSNSSTRCYCFSCSRV